MRSLLISVAFAGSLLASGAGAATVGIGNPIVAGTTVDTCGNCTYVLGQPFGVAGYQVTDYTIYAVNSGDITPLLFTRSNPDASHATFTLVGIGAARTVPNSGIYNFLFSLTVGTELTTANTYFGFANNGGPMVSFSYTGGVGDGGTFLLAPQLSLGGSTTLQSTNFDFNTQNSLNDRTYSVAASATSVVPEAATWAFMIAGFGLAGAVLRRRRALIAA